MSKLYVSLDLGFRNLGIAIWDGYAVRTYNLEWLPSSVNDMSQTKVWEAFVQRLTDILNFFIKKGPNTTLILEVPYVGRNVGQNGNANAIKLTSLYNCLALYYTTVHPVGRIIGFPPLMKKSVLGFDTKDKKAVVEWAWHVLKCVESPTLADFEGHKKKDDMADALVYLAHQVNLDRGDEKLSDLQFRIPTMISQVLLREDQTDSEEDQTDHDDSE